MGGPEILSFAFNDGRGWPQSPDGAGHSLVLLNEAELSQGSGAAEYGLNWRASTYLRGSPGRPDPPLPVGVVLNEMAAHTHLSDPQHPEYDSNDWIELYNPTLDPVTLGPDWYLTDDAANLAKWAMPADTVIPGSGWVSFDEVSGFHSPTNTGFGLSSAGEQVLLSYLPGDGTDRVVDAVSFKAQEEGWTWGRYPDGGPFWQPLVPTRDRSNRLAALSVVINEIMFHPPDTGGTNDTDLEEFIELYNPTPAPVSLYNGNGAWRMDGGVSLTFPPNITLAAGEYLLLVNFDPVGAPAQRAAFCALYGITNESLRLMGPYAGRLANSSDRVALEKPQAPEVAGDPVSWVLVDEVIYADQSPWPCGTDGGGSSLQRQNSSGWGADPLSWAASSPTAGRVNMVVPPGAPVIVAAPADRVGVAGATATFSVGVCGTPPYTYRWLFNETPSSAPPTRRWKFIPSVSPTWGLTG